MPTPKPVPGTKLAPMELPQVGGGTLTIGGARETWLFLVVYRGKHCPKCKTYLNILNDMLDQWTDAGFDVVVTSADPEEKALADQTEFGWRFPLAYGLTEDQMATLGLFVSDPLSETETDRRFAEPGHYVLKPDGTMLLVAISNGPAARPDLPTLLDGMIFTKTNDRPPRGTV